ncbi:MAG: hypothetical protein U1B30_06030 [Pseudomonadota bacterium]|nr:hypothetical protein [Pseudomonadota bacterium]
MNEGFFVFNFDRQIELAPYDYGFSCVEWSMNGAFDALEMVADEDSKEMLFNLISKNQSIGAIELGAAVVGAYFAYAYSWLKVPAHVIQEVSRGIFKGVETLNITEQQADIFNKTWMAYSNLVTLEFTKTPIDEDIVSYSYSELANTIFNRIKSMYSMAYSVDIEVFELNRMRFEVHIYNRTVGLMHKLLVDFSVKFIFR